MIFKLQLGTGVKVSSPETIAYVTASAVYYDEQYQEIIIRLYDSDTDLASSVPFPMWKEFSEMLDARIGKGSGVIDATYLPLFRSVSREYTMINWRPYGLDEVNSN